ncbi:hypothetical protein HGRIS_011666 [Hohenbuehelia grisea]|uniref:F-box domain-containing protein n=1 Tax=Hohenbuehelia grisea TaxID=104357 RepID=A0ABR3JVZ7_9AGAR
MASSQPIIESPFSGELGTNYEPSAEDIVRIDEFLKEPLQEISRLDAEIARHMDAVNALRATRNELHTKLVDTHLALKSPMRRVPRDVLEEIFWHCLAADHNPVRSTKEPPLLLVGVCRKWRNVALSTPRLWRALHIVLSKGIPEYKAEAVISERVEGIRRWLQLSGAQPLSISITSPKHPSHEDIHRHLHEADLLVTVLMDASHRWRRIKFNIPGRNLHSLRWLTTQSVPKLESLSIFRPDESFLRPAANFIESGTSSQGIQMESTFAFLRGARRLSELVVHIPTPSFLASISPQHLTTLVIRGSPLRFMSVDPRDILDVLRSTANTLVSFRIQHAFFTVSPVSSTQPRSTILLPRLEVLALHSLTASSLSGLLDDLLAPALKVLRFEQMFSNTPSADAIPLHSMLHRSLSILDALHICSIPCDQLIAILGDQPSLRRLEIEWQEVRGADPQDVRPFLDALWPGLSRTSTTPYLCPVLQDFDLRNCPCSDILIIDTLNAHLQTLGSVPSPLLHLRSLHVTFPPDLVQSEPSDGINEAIQLLRGAYGLRIRFVYPTKDRENPWDNICYPDISGDSSRILTTSLNGFYGYPGLH